MIEEGIQSALKAIELAEKRQDFTEAKKKELWAISINARKIKFLKEMSEA